MTHADFTGASPNAHLLVGEMPAPPQFRGRRWEGTGLSIAAHAIAAVILLYAASHMPQAVETAGIIPEKLKAVFIAGSGPGGQDSGGGPKTTEPPRKREIAPARPLDMTPATNPADTPLPEVIIPIIAAQAQQTLPGALIQMSATSPGPGPGGGRGPGSGPGDGPGVGLGGPRGFGGDVHGVGNGVTAPQLIREVRPAYTVNAMRAKLQGVVEMEAVVLPDGSVAPGSVRITRSLDSTFGLDEQAIIAVRQWHFRPGTLKGQPVAVRVNVELTFTLR